MPSKKKLADLPKKSVSTKKATAVKGGKKALAVQLRLRRLRDR